MEKTKEYWNSGLVGNVGYSEGFKDVCLLSYMQLRVRDSK